ncbi:hypothetical protein PCK1_002042 [Pneumocystis canis]|nr:hypothetical protein PCK1_002042 [Pneumocystis canis]
MALQSISYNISGITSIIADDDRVIAGSIDGIIYKIECKSTELNYELQVRISQRSVQQMVYMNEASLIACLIDSQVMLYDLNSLRFQGILPYSNNAFEISLISYFHEDNTDFPIIISKLAVVFKHKLSIYSWHNSELNISTIDIILNQRVKTLTWINPTKLCLCFASAYAFADSVTKNVSKPIFVKNLTSLKPLGTITANMNYIYLHTKSPKFLVTRISDHEFLLSYYLKAIFINNDGHLLERKPIIWDSVPTHIVYFHPHLITAFDHCIKVYNIESYILIQTFDIKDTTSIYSGKYLFVSTQSQLWKFSNTSFDNQVNNLISQNRLDDALTLLNKDNSLLFQNKTSKIRYIKMMKAYQLFNKGDYRNSMILYAESSAPPLIVISLFPLENFDCKEYINDASISTYIHASKIFFETMSKKINQLNETSNNPDLDLKEATHALVSYYLNDTRRKLSILISSMSQFEESSQKTLNESLISKYHFTLPDSDNALTIEEMEKLLEIVDTALFRAYMFAIPNLVGPLVRLQNKIHLTVAKNLLEENKGIISDSIYNEQFKGPSETIDYLKKLNDNNIEEILSFIKWPFEIDPDSAMEVFLTDNQQIFSSRKTVYNFLLSFNEDLAIQYLEYLINCLDDATPEFHDCLIMHYFKIAEKEENSTYISEKLLKLLIDSEKYNLEYIFEHLPKDNKFLEHKAIILSKLGRHKHALEIYIFEIKDFKKATEYCERMSSMENSKLGNKIYLILLDILLNSPNDQKVQLSYILNLLSQYRSQINIETIMSTLPSDIKISDLKLYLEGTIQDRITDIMNGKIICSLQIANLMRYQNKLIDICNKKHIITPEKTCQNCHKRLGQSVLAIFPNDSIVHYGCQRAFLETQNMPYIPK